MSSDQPVEQGFEEVNITPDGKLRKKIIKSGVGEPASLGQEVYVYLLMKNGSEQVIIGSDMHPLKFHVGHQNAIEAIDRVLPTMKLGERAIITAKDEFSLDSKKELLKSKFKIDVADLGSLSIELEIIRFGKEVINKWQFPDSERAVRANKLKLEGNEAVKAKNFELAWRKYTASYQLIEKDTGLDFDDLKISVLSNLALANIKIGKPEKAVEAATVVIEKQPDNVKILYRRAVAYIDMRKFNEAREDLNQALKYEPENKEVIAELQLIKEKEKQAKDKEKQFYSRMLK